MPETDALQKATSDPDFYALSTGERKQFLSNFDPDFKGLDSKQQDQFLGLIQDKAKERSAAEIRRVASGKPTQPAPSLGSPKATPELFPGAIPPLPQGKAPVATAPPPQAKASPQTTPPPAQPGSPQILAEEPPAKPVGPAFVTPYHAVGPMPSKKSEDPGLEVWGENVANPLRQGKYGEAAKAVFASPVDMEAADRELSNFTYPIFGPTFGNFVNKIGEGGASIVTSPGNIVLGAGIGGLSSAAAKSGIAGVKAAWEGASLALKTYFTAGMVNSAGEKGHEAVEALKKKDYMAASSALGLGTVDALFAFMGAVSAAEQGADISRGIQDGVRIGKLRSAMQDELYRRESVRKEQERATRQPPKQIEAAKEEAPTAKPEEPAKPAGPREGTLAAARKAAESVFGKPTEEPEAEAAKPATEEKALEPKATEPPPEAAPAAKPVEPEKTEAPQSAKEAAPPPPAGTEKMYLQEGAVTEMPKEDIKVDPKRFQFKSKAVGRAGVTEDMSDVESFDPNAAGVLAVWKDPKDGNTYVVNGHHRLERAKSLNYDQPLLVRYIDAESDKDARTIGALINIKEGKGEPIDAAKVFREGGITPEELKKYGISMRGPIAKQGLALSKLSDSVFKKVATGELPEGYGVAIGDILTDEAHQEAAADMATEAQARGRKVTDSEFREALRLRIARAPVAVQETDTLFGKEEMRRSLALEVGEVSDYIKSQLSTDKRLFGAVGKEAAASKLSEGGNVIATEDNAKRSQQAGQAIDLYGRLSGQTGPVSEILDQAAKELAEGGNPRDVKQRAYERVRDQLGNDLSSIYGKGPTPPSKGTGVVGSERSAPPAEAKRPEPRPTDKPPTEAKGKPEPREVAPQSTAKLPRELAGANPRYSYGSKQFDLTFASDLDRAAYITAQEKRSAKDAGYLRFAMDYTGLSEEEVRAAGKRIRDSIKEQARDAEPGTIAVRRELKNKTPKQSGPQKTAPPSAGGKSLTREQATGDALTKELASRGKPADTGTEPIEDSPIFGKRQQELVPTEPPPEQKAAKKTKPPPVAKAAEPPPQDLSKLKESLAQNGFDKPYNELTPGQKESVDLRAKRRMAPREIPEKKPVTPQITSTPKTEPLPPEKSSSIPPRDTRPITKTSTPPAERTPAEKEVLRILGSGKNSASGLVEYFAGNSEHSYEDLNKALVSLKNKGVVDPITMPDGDYGFQRAKKTSASAAESSEEGLFGSERGGIKLSPETAMRVEEVGVKAKEFAKKVKSAGEVVIEMIAPRVGVPKKGMDAVMKALGENNRAEFVMQQTMGEIEDLFNQQDRYDNVEYMDRYKRGQEQQTPELQAIYETHRDMDEASLRAKKRYKESLVEKENHFRVFWKKRPQTYVDEGGQIGLKTGETPKKRGASGGGRRPIEGTRGWMKQSTLADVSEGLRWDLGAPMGEIDTRARAILKPREYKISQTGGVTQFVPLSDKAQRFMASEERRGTPIFREGGEPYSYNPQVLFARSMADDLKFVTAHRMWDYLKDVGLRRYVKGPADRPTEPTPEGFADLNDRLAQTFFKAESGEGVIEPGRWVVEKNVARILNNYLGRDYLRDSHLATGPFEKGAAFAGKLLLGAKNFTTGLELSVSPFHLMAESMEAVSTKFGVGFTRAWNEGVRGGDPKAFMKGLAEILEAPISPYTTAKTGGDIMRMATAELMPDTRPPVQGTALGNIGRAVTGRQRQVTPRDMERGFKFIEKNPEAQRMLGDLFNAGLKMDMAPEYKINTLRAFANNLRESARGESIVSNSIGALVRLLPSINEVLMKPLFEMLIPRLKIGGAYQDFGQQLSEHADDLATGKVTREELARQSVDRMENRFGEMNFDNLWWNRTMKTALQILVRSVTWRLGTGRAFLEAGAGQAKYLAEPVRMMLDSTRRNPEAGMKQFIPKLHPSMGWMVGLALTSTLVAEIWSRLATGKGPADWAKEGAKKSGDYMAELTREILHPRSDSQLDERGKPHRMTPANYLSRDLEALINNPWKYATSGVSSIWNTIPEVWKNEDFFGNFLYDPNDPLYKKVMAGAGHIIGQPFIASTYKREKESGASTAQIIGSFAGFPPASRDVDRTTAERLVAELKKRHPHKFTPEELSNIQEHRKLISRYRQGDESVQADMDKAEMTGSEQASIRRAAGRSELVQGVTGLGVKEALQVWDAASPTEKQTIYRALIKKRHLLNKIRPASERERMTKEFEQKVGAYEEPVTETPPEKTRTDTPPPIGRQ